MRGGGGGSTTPPQKNPSPKWDLLKKILYTQFSFFFVCVFLCLFSFIFVFFFALYHIYFLRVHVAFPPSLRKKSPKNATKPLGDVSQKFSGLPQKKPPHFPCHTKNRQEIPKPTFPALCKSLKENWVSERVLVPPSRGQGPLLGLDLLFQPHIQQM